MDNFINIPLANNIKTANYLHFLSTRYFPVKIGLSYLKSLFFRIINETHNQPTDRIECVDRDFFAPLPKNFVIEPGAYCNLNCCFCPTGRRETELPKGFMRFETFRKIVSKISPHAKCIALYNWGEPLLNPDILKMISFCYRNGISTLVDSNLSIRNMDKKDAELIVRSGLTSLKVAIDGCSQATYEKYRRGGNFDRAISNLSTLVEEKNRIGSETPHIEWKFLINRYNQDELLRAVKTANLIGVRITFKLMDVWNEETWESKFHKKNSAPKIFGKKKKSCSSPHSIEDLQIHPTLPNWCKQLFNTMIINWDGNVLPCCNVYKTHFYLGNILEQDLEELWNSAAFKSCRKFILNYGPKQSGRSVCESFDCPLGRKYIGH